MTDNMRAKRRRTIPPRKAMAAIVGDLGFPPAPTVDRLPTGPCKVDLPPGGRKVSDRAYGATRVGPPVKAEVAVPPGDDGEPF